MFSRSDDYDAWLMKMQRAASKSARNDESESEDESESNSDSEEEEEDSESDSEDEEGKHELVNTDTFMSRVNDVVEISDDEVNFARLERGEPIASPQSPPRTRQAERLENPRPGASAASEMPALSPERLEHQVSDDDHDDGSEHSEDTGDVMMSMK